MEARQKLNAQIESGTLTVAPGVYDGLTAALVKRQDFNAAYMSGAAVASSLGLPDLGLTSQSEMASRAALLTGVLGDVPLIADADTGFGDIINVVRTVQLYERAGVSAIQLEDQLFPKKCGHLDSKEVIAPEDFQRKIEAVVEARTDDQMLVIARTDALASLGFDDAVARAKKYVEAGADIIFIEAPQSAEQIAEIPGLFSRPTLFNLVPRGKTPAVSLESLQTAGYSIVIAPGLAFGAAADAVDNALATLRSGDTDTGRQWSPTDLFRAVGLDYWDDIGKRFAAGTSV
ncbi:isocitrate lyase/PEP mutase family protein [Mycobacterium sp. 21AC1]|uniref:isocitrate lyase/PEP mutase family protein n=1 Tax=[Mycobacterium] appelbergii TaxID=2939269 RepID=UPI002938FD3E|nr:isocitrate lyase/PEP mutase family protein [Mycobacterium sp. 21AC1]MDV3130222.1 isocitrate lyase/PEP mutase family protein [Mycobacterium sp. 21AC1]